MGEMTEAILEGIFCQECGEWMEGDGAGHPVTCSVCRRARQHYDDEADDEDYTPGSALLRKASALPTFRATVIQTLRQCARKASGGQLYDGMKVEFAPAQVRQLVKHKLVEIEVPHNPVHKDRAVATPLGRALLILTGHTKDGK